MTPFFSVIIPLYNKEKYIEATLKSVLNQSFKDFEIIIVNDGSTDKGLEIASKINDAKISIFDQKNQGPSVARNKAITNASGKYIAPLDADDIWQENHLQELKSLIDSFPNAGLYCNNYSVKLNENFTTNANFNFVYDKAHLIVPDFFNANIYNYIPSSSSTAFLKSSFIELGAYNVNLRTGQDLDLWIKFALKHDVAFNPTRTMIYNNFDDASLSKSNLNNDRYNFISYYHEEEKRNASLKKYLDINRYAVALRCKMNDETELYKKLKSEIDYKHLNIKQKLLLQLPKGFLLLAKKAHQYLKKKKIYLTSYS